MRRRRCCPESCEPDARRGLHPCWRVQVRLTSLPRRQAVHRDPSVHLRGWGPGRASQQRTAAARAGTAAGQHRGGGQRSNRGGAMGAAAAGHVPVLRDRVIELLQPALAAPGAVLVDATLGRAGHASAILSAHPGLSLIGIDTDATAIAESREVLTRLRRAGHPRAGRLRRAAADPGQPGRARRAGRAVRPRRLLAAAGRRGPRASPTRRTRRWTCGWTRHGPLTAADVLNTYPAERLAQVLRDYGEERFARRIADAVVRERARQPFTSTRRLADIIRDSIPRPPGAPAATRPSGPSRRCASRSTASWTRCAGRCPRRSTRSRSVAGSWCWLTTRWRTGS